MKSMIKEIYSGNICGELIKMSTEEDKYYGTIVTIEEELKQKLSPELFALLEKFVDAIETKNSVEIEHHYAEGFKVGIRLGLECSDKE